MNGIILRHGYIVAEFGDVEAVDPSYSMAKSYLSTILGLTIDRGMIGDVHDEVGLLVEDGGYDMPHNSKVTWKHHATQSSEWQGELFAKSTTFVDVNGTMMGSVSGGTRWGGGLWMDSLDHARLFMENYCRTTQCGHNDEGADRYSNE